MIKTPVATIIKEATERTSIVMQSVIGMAVNFMQGPEEEIEGKLIQLTDEATIDQSIKKFPAIILFHDFPVDYSGEYDGVTRIPTILICAMSDNTWLAEKRYSDTFIPIIHPILNEFLNQLSLHKNVVGNDDRGFNYRYWDRLYCGTKTLGKKLNDYVDAGEIENLQLPIKQYC